MQNKLTIIPSDLAVYVDGVALTELDLSSAMLPDNVHALQWVQNMDIPQGWIEFKQELNLPNEMIEELPQWALTCLSIWEAKMDEINNPPDIPTPELTQQDFINAIKLFLNETAIGRSYESEYSIASYVNSTNLTWKADAETYIAWRDTVWAYAYAILDSIQHGAPVPTINDFIAAAPQINW